MITIISSTNRPNSNSLNVAKNYMQLIEKQGVKCKLFSLESLPADFLATDLYNKRTENFQQLLNEFIVPAQKIVFIVPEYNGSFPGVLKAFLDAINRELVKGKKVALVGVATGRGGNIRGMDHLTGILNYMGMFVLPNLLPVSNLVDLVDKNGVLKDENTIKVMEKQIEELVKW